MKNITYLFLTVLFSVVIVSCEKDDLVGSVDYRSSVKILSQKVLFEAAASSGTIEFQAPSPATVKSTSDWCTVSLTGEKVTVDVTENGSLNSRQCLVVIKSGNDSTSVSVVQSGLIFQLEGGLTSIVSKSDDAKTFEIGVKSNVKLNLTCGASWFTADYVDNKILVNISENATGHLRQGWIYYNSDTYRDSVKVTQFEYAKDIAGEMRLYYFNSNGKLTYTDVVLKDGYLLMTDYASFGEWKLPCVFDEEEMVFTIQNLQTVGNYSSYYVSNVLLGGGYLSYSSSVYCSGVAEYDEESDALIAEFTNSNFSRGFDGIILYAFTAQPYGSQTAVGSLIRMENPFLVRFTPEAE
ncbi:MAG: hypothetical protein MJZ18_04180 [Bacteroidales bacterium]|nr:hypothetical protein [Bacteroidales bacterium]